MTRAQEKKMKVRSSETMEETIIVALSPFPAGTCHNTYAKYMEL